MRIEYTSNPPNLTSDEDKATLEKIKARRGPRGLIPLDLALLHAPKLADGWNGMLAAVRSKSSLPDNIREICMLRPALINGAWFEWHAHLPIYKASNGYKEESLATIQDLDPKSQGALTNAEWVVLRYADTMTKHVKVPQALFDELKTQGKFNEQEIIEITGTIASYNMVSRFLVALDVGEFNDRKPDFIRD